MALETDVLHAFDRIVKIVQIKAVYETITTSQEYVNCIDTAFKHRFVNQQIIRLLDAIGIFSTEDHAQLYKLELIARAVLNI